MLRFSARRRLDLARSRLLGIVNATPDSFSDGGAHGGFEGLVAHGLRMLDEGADALDVGGESTRPGAAAVPADEQIARTVPLIARLRAATDAPITIDTTRAAVAAAALDAGADAVNDVSAGLDDPAMLPLVAARGAGIVLMHRLVPPAQDVYSHEHRAAPRYDDVVDDVRRHLRERAAAARAAGVAPDAIAIDPGLGFGKSVEQNWLLIARIDELVADGPPVLGGASRKSFVGHATGVERPAERVAGSIAAALLLHHGGVRLFRVHDVRPHREALDAADAACAARAGWARTRNPHGPPGL